MVGDANSVGDDGQRWVNAGVGWEEAAINNIKIIDVMSATVKIEH